MNYNENYEITILKEHLKYMQLSDATVVKQKPPSPDYLINNNMYYEITFCSYDSKTAEIYHKINRRIPLNLDKPINNVENNDKLIDSVLSTINKKKAKWYSCDGIISLNLLIHVYHGPNIDQSFFDAIKSIVVDTGQFSNIFIQTGYATLRIPGNRK